MSQSKELSEAIDRLANLFEFGQLTASTNPADLLNEACEELIRHRKLAEKHQRVTRSSVEFCVSSWSGEHDDD